MNPFLEVPVMQIDDTIKQKNNFWKTPYIDRQIRRETMRLRPGEIETYQSTGEHVKVTMKSGKEHTVEWSFDFFDQALNSYNNTINSKEAKGKFGNVVMTNRQDKVAIPNS